VSGRPTLRNAIVLQCGGPTAVINASLAAVIQTWQQATGQRGRLLGARDGTRGLAAEDWTPLDGLDSAGIGRLAQQPGMALGGGRHKLEDAALPALLDLLARREVDALFFIGGNGTAAAAHRLAAANPALTVCAIPKTVDNDLPGTDVAPGYASAARFTAQSLRDARLDLHAMRTFDDVVVYEVMGRHAGWLAAASVLARTSDGSGGPDLVLLPEASLDEDALLERIAQVHARAGVCLVAAAEGVRDGTGAFLAEKLGGGGADDRGQRVLSMASGVSAYLCALVQQRLGLRTRQVRANTLQRVGWALASELDRELAWMVGAVAVQHALEGATDQLLGLARAGDQWHVQPVPLGEVVGRERHVPAAWLAPGFDVAPDFAAWAAPLVEPLAPDPITW
jgi:6-phosphofructokinase 1